jgi:shikimate dehydrogenase
VITGTTRVYALLGDPVAHSLSPRMHGAAFIALGLPAVYIPLRCSSADLPNLIGALSRAGGGGNVTVPHKEAALRSVDQRGELAQSLESCNTFWSKDGRTVGDNTDVPGLLDALHQLEVDSGPWFIAGTGGGARAAVAAAREHGVAVAVQSRTPDRQAGFERWVTVRGVPLAPAAECRVLINTTPLGLRTDDPFPIDPRQFAHAEFAFDMVYAPGETRWVRAVRSTVRRAADGRAMLVAQGAAALECWFPEKRAPVEIMRAAVNAALRA